MTREPQKPGPQEQKPEKPSKPKPDPNVKPPQSDIVTEGYDPSEVKKKTMEKKK